MKTNMPRSQSDNEAGSSRLAPSSLCLRKEGFTLVELLVVIAVITAVIFLSIPAAQRVRSYSQVARCTNNLQQLSTAVFAYAMDHNMTFPEHYLADTKQTITLPWYLPLSAQSAPKQIGEYEICYIHHAGYGKKKRPFFCESNPRFNREGQLAWTNYAFNGFLIGKKMASVSTKKVMLMDSYFGTQKPLHYISYGPSVVDDWQTYRPVHGNFAQFAFTDGHIESVFISDSTGGAPSSKIMKDWFEIDP